MISYLKGRLIRNNVDYIVIEVKGVGYKVYVPANIQESLPKVGEEVEVYTHHYVREDNISLYGFSNIEEMELFEELLSVSKIGPKVGLNILATLSVNAFKLAIVNGEIESLKAIKGIGNKTAKRLILELQGKIDLDNIIEESNASITDNRFNDAVDALISLGYKNGEASKVIAKVFKEDDALSVEDLIKEGLKNSG
ncbi:Holliday junction branch migration protein RuvA [Halonatronum saccharophilum]|uniref:Holliday junction branch migration protein RuvA n=1 Tax=Halonatronum saccharophilum TaxID=150060 RepID=UPI000484ACA6|nr:Holliday junction branch migration protein RuvA [Halonatronum saccharophilum]